MWITVIVILTIVTALFPLIIKTFVMQAFKIPAGSMIPTLEVGDQILVDKTFSARAIRRGDIVIFKFVKDRKTIFVKRVIGLPGETIEVRKKQVYINGSPIDEPYVVYTDGGKSDFGPAAISENSCFVLGDNRDNSFDSRFWGELPLKLITGKAFMIYWSWDKGHRKARWERIGMRLSS